MSEDPSDTNPSENLSQIETLSEFDAGSEKNLIPGHPKDQIDQYRIIKKLGEGGMGEVYEAEQLEPIRRKVALKLIRSGMDSKLVLSRFEMERQSLALMKHANVAQIYDAGASESGQPYFVMEFISGVPIDSHCDNHMLNTRQRLELFMQVCEGIQHAHQKGIIHRDIKPSNILVEVQDTNVVPKIIDFGIAKAMHQTAEDTASVTQMGQIIGTFLYMSPEQITGEDIDTRTDVYALGVLLYKLLVGVHPLTEKNHSKRRLDEILQRICEKDPTRPSTQVSTLDDTVHQIARQRSTDQVSLARELRGDLDWITMKALEKDRTRRYNSPSELAADIERHLKNEPVSAYPPSTVYSVVKFIRRHVVGVAAAALILLALLVGIAGTTIGLIRAREAEKLAQTEAAQAKAINDFMQETLGSANPVEGTSRDITLLEVLEGSIDKIHESFADQPEVEAELKRNIGLTFLRLGHYDKAEILLKESFELYQIQVGAEDQGVIECLNDLAVIRNELGDYEGAENYYRQTMELSIQKNGEENEDVAGIMSNLGLLLQEKGDLDGAEQLFHNALNIDRKIFGDKDINVAIDINNLGKLLIGKKEYEEGERLLNEACSIFKEAQSPFLAMCMGNQGQLLTIRGEYQKAETILAQALSLQLNYFGEKNQDLAFIRSKYGSCLLKQNKFDLAEEQLEMAFTILQQTLGIQNGKTQNTISELAVLYATKGDREKESYYRALLDSE